MGRARVVAPDELRRLLAHIEAGRHALRNATQVLLTYWAGLRVGEVASLRWLDVVDGHGRIRTELTLRQKGRPPRVVLLSARMRRQLATYANAFPCSDPLRPFFLTQKRTGWTANTLAQHFLHLYRAAGLQGASSHSGRRTFVNSLVRRGIDRSVVRDLAGYQREDAMRAALDLPGSGAESAGPI